MVYTYEDNVACLGVTTPYCSGLSLLRNALSAHIKEVNSNHPLLFGTVSPTHTYERRNEMRKRVTTPYCSGLSLLQVEMEFFDGTVLS